MEFKTTMVSDEEIEQRYQELSQKYNPAFNSEPENLVKFKKIQGAYECLKTQSCKMQYNKYGSYISTMVVNMEAKNKVE